MAQVEQQSTRRARWRRRLASTLLSLFPAMVAVGLLAPGFVRVLQEQGEAEAPAEPIPILDQPLEVRPNLLVPRDFSTGFIPELLDLDQLFLKTRYRLDPTSRRLAGLLSFPRNRGDTIVLDDVDTHVHGMLFKDALASTSVVEPSGGGAPLLHPLLGTLPLGNGLRFDDFTGGDRGGLRNLPVVPEPGTAPLLALGLVYLALRRRSSRAA